MGVSHITNGFFFALRHWNAKPLPFLWASVTLPVDGAVTLLNSGVLETLPNSGATVTLEKKVTLVCGQDLILVDTDLEWVSNYYQTLSRKFEIEKEINGTN